jgi:hypothetical protein
MGKRFQGQPLWHFGFQNAKLIAQTGDYILW